MEPIFKSLAFLVVGPSLGAIVALIVCYFASVTFGDPDVSSSSRFLCFLVLSGEYSLLEWVSFAHCGCFGMPLEEVTDVSGN